MPVHNADIAAIFEEIADLLEIDEANPFRVRAYRNAARELLSLGTDVGGMLARGEDLTTLPGIGADLAGKIAEIAASGRCATLERLRKRLPPSITSLLRIPGLGPKRVKALYHELDVETLPQLARAARDGRIRRLAGFGARTEAKILASLEAHASAAPPRVRLAVAAQYAEPYRAWLERGRGVQQAVIAGSYRRARETVGDIDILVTATDADEVIRRFVGYDEVTSVAARGRTRATVVLRCGLQVDLRVVDGESYGAALQYFTGSKAHGIEIRRLARERGLKLSEYGVFKGHRRIAGDTEESVYAAVGLPWIPPELRENHGEIEAARAGRLPQLVELADLRGDLHAHTRATDGHDSIEAMAAAARDRGLEYLAITEHSRHLTVAHGLDARRLRRQLAAIDRLNAGLSGITVLKGVEVDILEDGNLDLPDDVLGACDLVVGAVHSAFGLSRERQTGRLLRAMDRPHFSILAHPTGRLLDVREPYDVDMASVVRHARARGCFLELNSHPDRLDLFDVHCRMARDEGVLVAISSDAHRTQDFDSLRHGVGQARRGWLGRDDVLNTRPLGALRKLLARTMTRTGAATARGTAG